MARYTGAVCKICRRAKTKLNLKGERCSTVKCSLEARPGVIPGQMMNRRVKKLSNYGVQLLEKQKLRKTYGVLESQFRKYYELAKKRAVTGEALIQILESRLDNLVYRMGFGESRAQARQIVTHGHILLDGRKATIPSMLIKPGSTITVRENSKFRQKAQSNHVQAAQKGLPDWLRIDGDKLEGVFVSLPDRSKVMDNVQEQLVVEFYSR
jgi:small subunit ribosomal protein S4